MDSEKVIIDFLKDYRIIIILGLFFVTALLEVVIPERKNSYSITSRWTCNFSMQIINTLMAAWLYPLVGIGIAITTKENTFGLFNQISLGFPLVWIASLIILDIKHYLYHRLLHRVSWMWRFHRVHHSDRDYDLSTGFLFHPFEAFIGFIFHITVIILFGIPVSLVLFYGLLTYFINFFTHGNFHLNPKFDSLLRLVIVTPNMHRIHHSEEIDESNTNFGASFSVWDRLFGSYRHNAHLDQQDMIIGIGEFPDQKDLGFIKLLTMPFVK